MSIFKIEVSFPAISEIIFPPIACRLTVGAAIHLSNG
jgi:hypothetical protein